MPNLVAGTSVWNLVRDLNAPGLFDGRLLEPEIDGPDSLPTAVEWDLTGLVPLAEARAAQPVEVQLAIDAFLVCLERAERWLDDEGQRYHDAFTLPSLGLDDGAHYFYSPRERRLYVKNWGATPHRAGGAEVHTYGPRGILDLMQAQAAADAAAVEESRPRRAPLGWILGVGLALAVALVLAFALWPAADRPAEAEPPPAADPPPRSEPPTEPEIVPPPLPQPTQQIHFAVDQPTLEPAEYATLEQVRAYLEEHPSVRRLRVEGHTDGRGERTHNDDLGRARGAVVVDWLVSRGVSPTRLEVASCADRVPAADNATEAGRQENRRVELYVVDPPVARAPHLECVLP
ncbi:MAG: OmpA family protein [Sandaracinaceae bacterium]|nr:OmpA family protein [Sandaracinaceae bacterium]